MQIQPIVVGTAGHIDHGKSSLVRALTGTDPDRLKEEKERGLTIDLGFANFELSDGRRVGLVDVPGHERFIRNMVAGASGIDIVVLAVAADDGVMPQTREHLGIMQMLGLSRGLIALTKVDTVEPDLVELARADLEELLAGTFLEDAPVFPLSSITGEGLDAFKAELDRVCLEVTPRSAEGVFRMPIQRVFSKPGFGTVCTGIPVTGVVKPGDVLELLPGGKRAKVRGVHAYGASADQARAGHSSALNLSDLDAGDAERGYVLSTPGLFRAVRMVAARIEALPTLPRAIRDRVPIRLHAGTADPSGELVLLDVEQLEPGGSALVQLRLDEAVVVAPGDRFVLRLLTPEVTLGGGVILEESRHRLKRFKKFVIEELVSAESSLGAPEALLAAVLERRHMEPASVEELAVEIKFAASDTERLLAQLVEQGRAAVSERGDRYLSSVSLEAGLEQLDEATNAWFEAHSERVQVDKLELGRETGLSTEAFSFLVGRAIAGGTLESVGGGELRRADVRIEVSPEDQVLLDALTAGGMRPPLPKELPNEQASRASLSRLVDLGLAVRASHEMFFAKSVFDAGIEAVAENCGRNGQLVIPELREKLDTSRKYLIPYLEHLDATGVTMRQGSFRVMRRR